MTRRIHGLCNGVLHRPRCLDFKRYAPEPKSECDDEVVDEARTRKVGNQMNVDDTGGELRMRFSSIAIGPRLSIHTHTSRKH